MRLCDCGNVRQWDDGEGEAGREGVLPQGSQREKRKGHKIQL